MSVTQHLGYLPVHYHAVILGGCISRPLTRALVWVLGVVVEFLFESFIHSIISFIWNIYQNVCYISMKIISFHPYCRLCHNSRIEMRFSNLVVTNEWCMIYWVYTGNTMRVICQIYTLFSPTTMMCAMDSRCKFLILFATWIARNDI